MRNWSSLFVLTASVLVLLMTLTWTTDGRFLRSKPGFKQSRSTRGFKEFKDGNLQVGRGFGKRASENNDLFELDDNALNADLDNISGSFPLEWIADKMENNPAFARSILRKFVDLNGDGQLTMEELLRPTI